jgi:hypothetical protein
MKRMVYPFLSIEQVGFTAEAQRAQRGRRGIQISDFKSRIPKRNPLRFLRVLCACGGEVKMLDAQD